MQACHDLHETSSAAMPAHMRAVQVGGTVVASLLAVSSLLWVRKTRKLKKDVLHVERLERVPDSDKSGAFPDKQALLNVFRCGLSHRRLCGMHCLVSVCCSDSGHPETRPAAPYARERRSQDGTIPARKLWRYVETAIACPGAPRTTAPSRSFLERMRWLRCAASWSSTRKPVSRRHSTDARLCPCLTISERCAFRATLIGSAQCTRCWCTSARRCCSPLRTWS